MTDNNARLTWMDKRGAGHMEWGDRDRLGSKLERLARRGLDASLFDASDRLIGESAKEENRRTWWWEPKE